MIEIPRDHWQASAATEGYIPIWEKSLRATLEAQPDPAKRFAEWLKLRASGKSGSGIRLVFVEQPYLEWAELVERALEKAEEDLRALIAWEVTHPHDE